MKLGFSTPCIPPLAVLALATGCAVGLDEGEGGDPVDFDVAAEVARVANYGTSGAFKKVNGEPYPSSIAESASLDFWVSSDAYDTYLGIEPQVLGSGVEISEGTILVREVHGPDGGVNKLAIMGKGPPGYNPELGDWWFAVTDPTGAIRTQDGQELAGRLEQCYGCHLPRKDDDYLFGVPEEARAGDPTTDPEPPDEPEPGPVCGDFVCESDESCTSCAADCVCSDDDDDDGGGGGGGGGGAPVEESLTHNSSLAIEGEPDDDVADTVGCYDLDTGRHADNRYFQVFDLAQDFGITGDFDVSSVTVGLLKAAGGDDGIDGGDDQPFDVILHRQDQGDVLDLASASQIGAATDFVISDGTRTNLEIPVTGQVPAGEALVVEFAIPDGTQAPNSLHVGTNDDDAPGAVTTYLVSDACGIPASAPLTFEQLDCPADAPCAPFDWVLEVTGTHTP